MSELAEQLKRFDSEYWRLLCDGEYMIYGYTCDFDIIKRMVKDSLLEMVIKS